MQEGLPFASWQAALAAPRSPFFRGRTRDTVADREASGPLAPHAEALFTQSNARVLLGQAAGGRVVIKRLTIPVRIVPCSPRG